VRGWVLHNKPDDREQEQLRKNLVTISHQSLVLIKRTRNAETHADETETTRFLAKLKEMIFTNRFDLVVLDPLIKLHAEFDENSTSAMQEVANVLLNLAEDGKCAVVVAHHTSKSGTGDSQHAARGASSIVNATRMNVTLEPMSEALATKLLPEGERPNRRRS